MTRRRVVAVLGTRYQDLAVEEAELGALGVDLVLGDGGSPAEILRVGGDAEVVLAGSRPRFDATVLDALRARGCRGIVRYGIGTDSIDLDAARSFQNRLYDDRRQHRLASRSRLQCSEKRRRRL